MDVPGLPELLYDAEEQLEPTPGRTVSGEVPSWLSGSLYQSGPAKFQLGDGFSVNHWFDGLAMVCKFALSDGQVTLQKRFVQSDAYKKATKYNKTIYTEFGTRAHTDPSRGFFSRLVSSILPTDMTDNNFNNVIHVNGQLFAACETTLVSRIDAATLETLEKVDLSQSLGVNLCCSHPVTDRDGSVYTLGVTFIPGFRYQVNRIPPAPAAANGKQAFAGAQRLLSMPSSWTTAYSYYHSFGVTASYIVLLELPLLLVLSKVMTMVVKGLALKDCIEWHPEHRVKVHLVHKADGKLVKTKYITDVPFFQTHVCNAFEEDGTVMLDLITSEGPSVMEAYFLDKLREGKLYNEHTMRVTRLAIPVLEDLKTAPENVNLVGSDSTRAQAVRRGDTVTLSLDLFPEEGAEYPTINPAVRGRPYRYLYATGGFEQGPFRSAVGKLDTHSRTWQFWRGEEGTFPSEATFVARPGGGGAAEDAGVLLTALLGAGRRPDRFMVLDAGRMEPLACVEFQSRVPVMVHGTWVPTENTNEADGREGK
ncbi:beta,beta-carotene 9',10'-oxygenase-like [Amphibalanus amphitrite]|uniref:beta,beta-carotene 9',10'-oxygenase-like n=1 Tax=Amphibalanus amphitrite TaxID=1232801 RepID=UPI001C928FF4|nr:beta,beta-carotene 9',10'-oxygenase-like [Amphibalanus amphitrite]